MPEEVANETAAVEETAEETTQAEVVTEASMAAIQAELQAAQQAAQENLDGWQRARAEFANYKKRIEREMREARQNGALDAIADLLPIIDDFDRAMANVPSEIQENSWFEGVGLIQKKLAKLLETYAVEEIDPVGQPFDPNLHEAVSIDSESDAESGTVTATLQKGYASGERVLRPALVRVAN